MTGTQNAVLEDTDTPPVLGSSSQVPRRQKGKRWAFRSMKTRARVAVVGVTLLLFGLWAQAVFQGFWLAGLLHSPLVATLAWIELVGGPIVIGGFVGAWVLIAPRHVVRMLELLVATATRIAERDLPAVSERVKNRETITRETINVEIAVPGQMFPPDEFGDVGDSIVYLGRCGGEGILDAGRVRQYSAAMKDLAHRMNGLTKDLLAILDQSERRTDDPDRLDRLFGFDKLVVRQRRIIANLGILSGRPLDPKWRHPVPVFEIMRAATGEAGTLADQQRVEVVPVRRAHTTGDSGPVDTRCGPHIHGHAAGAVIHLLAELIDNALRFAPPDTKVMVVGEAVAAGYAVTIEDRGLGLTADQLEAINARLAGPPVDILAADPRQLGLYAAAWLAALYNITITLATSSYGGVRAIVLLPDRLPNGLPTRLFAPAPVTADDPADGGPAHPPSHLPVPGIPASATRPRQSADPAPAPRPLIRALPSATSRAPKPVADHERTNPPAGPDPQFPPGHQTPGRHEA